MGPRASRLPDTPQSMSGGQCGPVGTAAIATLDAMPEVRRPTVTFTAPIGSIDLAAFNADGEAYEIWPCQNCLRFHAEVVLDDDGNVFVREWHAVECAQFIELTSDVRHEQ